MDERELICKCGGEIWDFGEYKCRACGISWYEVQDWMKPAPREFSPAQQAIIDAAVDDANHPRHANCDGAPDGGHSATCLALDD